MLEMTPRKIVTELDRYIVGQHDAKRAVSIAIRNRWRRQKVSDEMKKEIGPKNMLMIGPTGVGKTEIARRLATLTGAPFIKVEATKYTEVGYYGRDVESMIRELVENAIGIIRTDEREKVRQAAEQKTEDILVQLLAQQYRRQGESVRKSTSSEPDQQADTSKSILEEFNIDPSNPLAGIQDYFQKLQASLDDQQKNGEDGKLTDRLMAIINQRYQDMQQKGLESKSTPSQNENEYTVDLDEIRDRLRHGFCENENVTIQTEQKMPQMILGGIGMESMENDFQNIFENILPKKNNQRELPVHEARKIIFEQQSEQLIDREKVNAKAIELAENLGIIFIDEIDKIVSSGQMHGADVSRQGVQRDLLPIVEGTTIQTKYGFISTEHILFIAAGAFHKAKPTDLMPELQGRFPIRVELTELTHEDFVRILTEPHGALTKQYIELMKTEGVTLEFTPDAVDMIAQYAFDVNQTSQNIGARRLYTIMERLLEELSFEAPDMKMGKVVVNASYVTDRLAAVVEDDDMSRFIL